MLTAGGQLYCMWDYEDGDTLYTLLYNQDATTDESNYYRFTCMVLLIFFWWLVLWYFIEKKSPRRASRKAETAKGMGKGALYEMLAIETETFAPTTLRDHLPFTQTGSMDNYLFYLTYSSLLEYFWFFGQYLYDFYLATRVSWHSL